MDGWMDGAGSFHPPARPSVRGAGGAWPGRNCIGAETSNLRAEEYRGLAALETWIERSIMETLGWTLPSGRNRVRFYLARGHGSVGRAQPCQGWGRGFEPRCPLHRTIRAGFTIGSFHIRRSGQVVRQRPAKPLPPVRIRASPPLNSKAESLLGVRLF